MTKLEDKLNKKGVSMYDDED